MMVDRFRRDGRRGRRSRPFEARCEVLEHRIALSGAPFDVDFHVDSDWGSGFTASVAITNQSGQDLKDWRLGFDLDTSISSIWDATLVDPSGSRFEVEGASWNPDLAEGQTVSFGFVGGAGDREPGGWTINGEPIGDDGPGPSLSLSIADAGTAEGHTSPSAMAFVVSLSDPSTEPVTVSYASSDGTARAGEDYEAISGTLTLAPGELTGHVTVPVLGDTTPEPDETLSVALSAPVGARIADGSAIGTIRNDDGAPPASEAPATPTLFLQDDNPGDGNLTVGFNIWSGVNATRWQLFENGVEVHAADLSASSPNAQSASVELTGRAYGAYSYQIVVSNAAGSRSSAVRDHVAGGASRIVIDAVDAVTQASQVTVDQGMSTFDLRLLGDDAVSYQVSTNNPTVVSPSISGESLVLDGLESGRASVRIEETGTGETRYLGVRVRTDQGEIPGMPSYLAVGSVSEDSAADLGFWRDFDDPSQNKRMDVRYIYLNGGPVNGWRTWQDGQRLQSFIRESQKLGMIPYFVWYNIPDGGESYQTNLAHVQDPSYMEGYFRDLKYALETIDAMAGDDPVGMVLEPDFLGYMMQIGRSPTDQVMARTDAAYSSGLLDPATDPSFDNTVQGLVQAINYSISTKAPNVRFGWQFNLWASPGIHTSIPTTGLMHLTDTMGLSAGRDAIAAEAREIADFYIHSGVLSHGADFVSIDKYGLDAVGYQATAATDPASSTWFWNADHWNNYLLFNRTLHESTGLPVTLWQIPVGHINTSLADNPYDPSGVFPDLSNTVTRYEDSAGTFFLGDTFRTTGARFDHFSANLGADPKVTTSGDTITWGSHMANAAAVGIDAVLFGAGVGASTDGVGSPPTDAYWWISQAQSYYDNPAPLGGGDDPTPVPPSIRVGDVTVGEGDGQAALTVSLSRSSDQPITVDYQTADGDGSATVGQDYSSVSGTVTFAPGETSRTVPVPVLADATIESDETIVFRLGNPIGASIADADAVITLRDDDAPTAPASIAFSVVDDWGTGFTGSITITNQSGADLRDWGLMFDFSGTITSIWDADVIDHSGDRYRIGPKFWNTVIPAGGRLTFGFVGHRAHSSIEPTNLVLSHA